MNDTVLGHPKGLVTLFFTEMWERLSFYGMRALLVLFMTDQVINGGMGLTDADATAIYGIYTALVYLVALPGGWIADRIIGAQSAILAGGIIIMCGHFVLAIPSINTFFLGLLLVILGTGLLKPNISAILGALYMRGDHRRDAGFSIFYMGINLGGMLGPIICGALAQNENFGWHYGFAVAGIGMLFGVIQFWKTRQYLGQAGRKNINFNMRQKQFLFLVCMLIVLGLFWFSKLNIENINFIQISEITTYIILFAAFGFFAYVLLLGKLNIQERSRVWVIIALFLGASMFWAGFEQAGSSLNLFANRYTKLEFGWLTLYSSWFQSVNSIFIIIFAPMFAYLWIWLAKKNLNPSTPTKFAIGLLFLALGFFMMVMASSIVANGNQAMPTWLLLTYLFHTFGELALSPVGLSVTTKLAPKRFVGQMMGIWFVASALGNLIAGRIAGEFNANNISSFPDQYFNIVLTSAGAGIILLLASKSLQKLMGDVE
jgi:POT family proton-dependent oligopeptide transporter